jgi:hypothetical protein
MMTKKKGRKEKDAFILNTPVDLIQKSASVSNLILLQFSHERRI